MDPALWKLLLDGGAIGISLLAVFVFIIHAREDRNWYEKTEALLGAHDKNTANWAEQAVSNIKQETQNAQILVQVGALGAKQEALATRVNGMSESLIRVEEALRFLRDRRRANDVENHS